MSGCCSYLVKPRSALATWSFQLFYVDHIVWVFSHFFKLTQVLFYYNARVIPNIFLGWLGDMEFLKKSWMFTYHSVLFPPHYIPINNCKVETLKLSNRWGLFLPLMYSIFWSDSLYRLCCIICCRFCCEILISLFLVLFFLFYPKSMPFRWLDARYLNTVDIFGVDFWWLKRRVVTISIWYIMNDILGL